MLAFVVALVFISSVYSQSCSNSGCWVEDDFTFSYARADDYVDIYATVKTDTWVGVGISEDKMMVCVVTAIERWHH